MNHQIGEYIFRAKYTNSQKELGVQYFNRFCEDYELVLCVQESLKKFLEEAYNYTDVSISYRFNPGLEEHIT